MAQQTKCRKKTEARREAILDAALEEFAAKGYAGARMEDIARRAGVAKGTLYLHFGDKEGLFNGLAESAFAPMHALAKAAGLLPRRTMDVDEALARRVLSGEKPKLDGERGWTLLQWHGLPVGFLKTGT